MSKAQEEKSVVFLRYPKSTPALKIASTIYTIKKFSMNIHKYGRACSYCRQEQTIWFMGLAGLC